MGLTIIMCLLALSVCVSLSACYPSDFFKEIIIVQSAEVVDEDNPDVTSINDPDAEDESDKLSALDVSDDAKPKDDEENIVTWTKKDPTVGDMSTHHSLFDFVPRYKGIKSSDGVRPIAVGSEDTKWIDHATDDKTKAKDAKSKSTGSKQQSSKSSSKSKKAKKSKKSDGKGKKTNTKGGGSKKKGGTGGNDGKKNSGNDKNNSNTPDGKEDDDNDGTTPIIGPGYGKDVDPVYNPNDKTKELQKASHIAAMGQAAVIVQAIGGKGALCAMDEDTYNGASKMTVGAFKDVFADELKKSLAKKGLQWSGSGTSSSDVKDIDKLIEQVGASGSIFYLGSYGSEDQYFTKAMLKKIKTASIQLVPVDLSTVDGITDAVKAVGEVLSESQEIGSAGKTEQMAADYNDLVKNIVSAVAGTHGGTLVGVNGAYKTQSSLLTSYMDCPVESDDISSSGQWTSVVVANAYETDVETNSSCELDVDLSDGLFFAREGCDASPMLFWLQSAGALACSAQGGANSLSVSRTGGNGYGPLLPFYLGGCIGLDKLSYGTGSLLSGIKLSGYTKKDASEYFYDQMRNFGTSGMRNYLMGPGSRLNPYLIVCGDETHSSKQAKKALVAAMKNEDSPYYAYSDAQSDAWITGTRVEYKKKGGGTGYAESVMGADNPDGIAGKETENVIAKNNIAAGDVAIANPTGLLGAWSEGSMESVLESVWAATLYSKHAKGSTYIEYQKYDLGKLFVDVDGDGNDEKDLASMVSAFYQKFYRYSFGDNGTSAAYEDVVVDEGPES